MIAASRTVRARGPMNGRGDRTVSLVQRAPSATTGAGIPRVSPGFIRVGYSEGHASALFAGWFVTQKRNYWVDPLVMKS